jgi:eukaryotic-like serine/threonine-protein kinase
LLLEAEVVAGPSAPLRLPGYEVVRLIGRGGMGEVYEAVRVGPAGFRKSIAVKQLPSEKVIDGASVQRFLQEARISAQLDHPNIVRIHDLVVLDGYFLVMELLRGWNLSEALNPHVDRVSWRTALEIAEQTLAGLAYAHALTDDTGRPLGLVHRDLTPRNLFLTEGGTVKILDFGLAKLVNALTPGLTEAGYLHGTVAFLAPEQARAEGSDPRSDLFQVGGIVYWLLTGRAPNGGGPAGEILARAANGRPTPLSELRPDLPIEVHELVACALEHAPADRFDDAAQMRSTVQAALRGADGVPGLAALVASLPPTPRPEPIAFESPGTVSNTVLKQDAAPTRALPTQPQAAPARNWLAILIAAAFAAGAGYLAGRLLQHEVSTQPAVAMQAPKHPSYRRMTFRPGYLVAARFAPDGKSIVYSASWAGAPMETVLKSIGSPETRALGLKGSEIIGLSKDGKVALLDDAAFHYAFIRMGTLAETSLSGGTPRELMVDAQKAEWTSDGQLAVLRWKGPGSTLELPPGNVLLESGESRWFGDMRLSPDGRTIALTEHPVRYDDRGRIVLYDRDTKKLTPLTHEFVTIRNLAWASDGEIWFTGSGTGDYRAVHAVTLAGELRTLEQTPGNLTLMDVLPDGRALISHEMMGARAFAKPRGGVERDLSWFDFDAVFDISADGSAFVFVEGGSDAGGSNYGAYLRKTDGSPAILLAEGIPWAIAPDGTRVVVTPKERDRIQIIPVGPGDHLTLASRTATVGAACWFDDNRRVLFATASSGGDRMFVLDTATMTTSELPHRGLRLPLGGHPIAPDGMHFAALESTTGRLMLVPIGPGESRPIAGAFEDEQVLRFSADGKKVLVGRFGDAPLAVARIDLATGKRTAWGTMMPSDPTGVLGIVSAAVAADLESYAYTATRVHSTLYLVENLR